jgi:hypothetical protein
MTSLKDIIRCLVHIRYINIYIRVISCLISWKLKKRRFFYVYQFLGDVLTIVTLLYKSYTYIHLHITIKFWILLIVVWYLFICKWFWNGWIDDDEKSKVRWSKFKTTKQRSWRVENTMVKTRSHNRCLFCYSDVSPSYYLTSTFNILVSLFRFFITVITSFLLFSSY